jgi:selenoprotein W-related protein
VADALRAQLGVDVQLIRGARGVFDVKVDGALVASKQSGGFPGDDEVVAAVRAAGQS